jgi:hypothetical protein
VIGGRHAGGHVRLDRTGDGGKAGRQLGAIAAGDQGLEPRHVFNILAAKAGDGEQDDVFSHRSRRLC